MKSTIKSIFQNFWMGVNKNFFWKQVAISILIVSFFIYSFFENPQPPLETLALIVLISVMAVMYPFAATSWNCLMGILFPNRIIFYNLFTLIILLPYVLIRTIMLFFFGILIAPFGVLYINHLFKKEVLQARREHEFQQSELQNSIFSALSRAGLTKKSPEQD